MRSQGRAIAHEPPPTGGRARSSASAAARTSRLRRYPPSQASGRRGRPAAEVGVGDPENPHRHRARPLFAGRGPARREDHRARPRSTPVVPVGREDVERNREGAAADSRASRLVSRRWARRSGTERPRPPRRTPAAGQGPPTNGQIGHDQAGDLGRRPPTVEPANALRGPVPGNLVGTPSAQPATLGGGALGHLGTTSSRRSRGTPARRSPADLDIGAGRRSGFRERARPASMRGGSPPAAAVGLRESAQRFRGELGKGPPHPVRHERGAIAGSARKAAAIRFRPLVREPVGILMAGGRSPGPSNLGHGPLFASPGIGKTRGSTFVGRPGILHRPTRGAA